VRRREVVRSERRRRSATAGSVAVAGRVLLVLLLVLVLLWVLWLRRHARVQLHRGCKHAQRLALHLRFRALIHPLLLLLLLQSLIVRRML